MIRLVFFLVLLLSLGRIHAAPLPDPLSIEDSALAGLLHSSDLRTTETSACAAAMRSVLLHITEETSGSRHIVHPEWKAAMLNLSYDVNLGPANSRVIFQNAFNTPIELTSEQWAYCLAVFREPASDFFLAYPWKVAPWGDDLSWGLLVIDRTLSRDEMPSGVPAWVRNFMEEKLSQSTLPPSYESIFRVFLEDESVADATSQQTAIANDTQSSDRDRSRAMTALQYISRIEAWKVSIAN